MYPAADDSAGFEMKHGQKVTTIPNQRFTLQFTSTHSHTDSSADRIHFGFSVLPMDTSTSGLEEPGIEPINGRATFPLLSPSRNTLEKKLGKFHFLGKL